MTIRQIITKNGLVVYDSETATTVRMDRSETERLLHPLDIDWEATDEHCEVVHMEVSNRCNLGCDYCYVPEKVGKELCTETWKGIIDKLADYGVFQVTFGGGEPLMRNDLIELAEHCESRGLPVCVTTNGLLLDKFGERLKVFRQVNISLHEKSILSFESSLRQLKAWGIPTGINYAVSKTYADNKYRELVERCAREYDATVVVLGYKAVHGDWDQFVKPDEVMAIARGLYEAGCKVAVDGMACNACMMKRRFADIDANGDVFPCSFVREKMGSLLDTDFASIWKDRGERIDCPYIR